MPVVSRLLAALLVTGTFPVSGTLDVQGHRGARGLVTENSIPAFEKALELGVNTLELDLQSTADRVLVVHHDQELNRKRCVGPDGRPVAGRAIFDMKLEELEDIVCGTRSDPEFPEQVAVRSGIPRLADVLELVGSASYPVGLSVEIKLQKPDRAPPATELAEILVSQLREAGLEERTIVQSFDVEALRELGARSERLRLAVLVRKRSVYDRALEESGATILSPKFVNLRRDDVTRMHERGIRVIPWTVNKPENIRRAIEWGVDGIISDYPDRVLSVLAGTEPEKSR
jgi:glycerophosphoryl diester phosphodiesterase